MKVLIIDDSSELRSLLESILPYGGHEVVSTSSGQEGLDLAAEVNPDVILVDLELPDTNGLKVLEELNRRALSIPTIMMTGYGSEGIAAHALGLGVQGYLIKPFTTEEVLSTIEKASSVGRLQREKEQLARLVERYAHDFQILSAVSRGLVTGLAVNRFLQRIVEASAWATQGEESALLLWDQQSEQLQVAASQGQASYGTGGYSALAGDARLRATLEQGQAVRLRTLPGTTIEIQSGNPVRAVLQVPLRLRDKTLGLLAVVRTAKDIPFGKHDEQMLGLLAEYAAVALERDSRGGISGRETKQPTTATVEYPA